MVMGFVPDTSGALAAFLDRPAPPWLSVRDGRGVENRLWREQDPEVQLALARFSFSRWSWEGAPWADAGVLLAMVAALRVTAYVVLQCSKKLQFS